jgi:hypothetical protein
MALFLAMAPAAAQPAADDADIGVRIQRDGERIIVDVNFPVAAAALDTWNVMTDYDHMSSFVSNLQSSRVISRDGNTLVIEQKGKAARGPFTFAFENVREIVLTPIREVRSRMITGNLEMSEFRTQVIDHGESSEIINHGEFIPKVWVPPIIGPAVIEEETRKQFQEFRAEILRRKARAATEKP